MSVVIYENALGRAEDINEFYIEGEGDVSFDKGAIRVVADEEVAIWCPKTLPADVRIDWDFRAISGFGASELIFAAKQSRDERSLDAFLLSFYRRRNEADSSFHVSRLYKNGDGTLVKGADPLPDPSGKMGWYHMSVVKRAKDVFFGINNLEILHFHDDGMIHGDVLTGGNFAFRQTGALLSEYRNLKVTWI